MSKFHVRHPHRMNIPRCVNENGISFYMFTGVCSPNLQVRMSEAEASDYILKGGDDFFCVCFDSLQG